MKKCIVCGAEIDASSRRRKYCSDACSRKAESMKSKQKSGGRKPPLPFRVKPCVDCGRVVKMSIKSTRCPDCQRERNKQTKADYEARARAGKTRHLGNEYICEACGKPYILEASLQRWCRDCQQMQNRLSVRKHNAEWNRGYYSDDKNRMKKNTVRHVSEPHEATCIFCGKPFIAKNAVIKLCSDECRKARDKQRNHDFHVQNKETIAERKRNYAKKVKEATGQKNETEDGEC